MAKCERCEEREAQRSDYLNAVLRYPLDLCPDCVAAFREIYHVWWTAGRPVRAGG